MYVIFAQTEFGIKLLLTASIKMICKIETARKSWPQKETLSSPKNEESASAKCDFSVRHSVTSMLKFGLKHFQSQHTNTKIEHGQT